MPDELERNKRTFDIGYWIAVAVGFAIALAYVAGSCAFGKLCS